MSVPVRSACSFEYRRRRTSREFPFFGRAQRQTRSKWSIFYARRGKKWRNRPMPHSHSLADTPKPPQIYRHTFIRCILYDIQQKWARRLLFAAHITCNIHIPLVSPITIIWCRTMSSLFASWLLIRMLPLGIRRSAKRIRHARVRTTCVYLDAAWSRQSETHRTGDRIDVTYLHVSWASAYTSHIHQHGSGSAAPDPCNI